MRIAFGIALALLMSPASGETLVERGAYLVNSVMVCHNCPHPALPSGPRSLSRALVSANITADSAAGLGGWSDDEIKRAITQGIARDGHKLKPPMAYAAYATMRAQDLDAIVAFVRTLPPKS